MLTKEIWDEWKLHPVTKAVLKYHSLKIEEAKDSWFNGQFAEADKDDATARGMCQGMAVILALDYEELSLYLEENRHGSN